MVTVIISVGSAIVPGEYKLPSTRTEIYPPE
jgi:hypothetical protein